jgi:hypothetical protein
MRIPSCLVVCTLGAACGNGSHATPDAGPCWPLAATPGGSVTIGTGDISYAPMPDMLPIVANGSQSDPFLQIHARMKGLPPGDPQDFYSPTNPRTMVGAEIPDLGLTLGVACPATIGYVVSPDDSSMYDLQHSLHVGLDTTAVGTVVGHQAIVTVTVVGSNGEFATDSKTVTLVSIANGS